MDSEPPIDQMDQYATRKTLIQSVQEPHNETAWEEFIEVYTRFIYAVIRRMNISEADSADIHQHVMLKLWKQLPKLDINKMHSFRGYLSTVTKNEVLQFIRSRKRRLAREERAGADSTINYLNAIRIPDLEAIAENEWRIHLTNLAMEKIEPLFSKNAIQVFRLSMAGRSAEEVAKRTGLTLTTVNTLKSRVKARFTTEVHRLKDYLE